jgi:surfactin synthase thioesterase subunit
MVDRRSAQCVGQASCLERCQYFAAPGTCQGGSAVLFCLPFAGGAASAYARLRKYLPGEIDLQPVQLPGREVRLAEEPFISIQEITTAILRRADRPYAIYGHCMGARIGFEVVRELRRRGAPRPARLYVGAAAPPGEVEPFTRIGRLHDRALAHTLVKLGGIPRELLQSPELQRMALRVLRADLRWLEEQRYTAEPPLSVPIVALAGGQDKQVSPSLMAGWYRHTSRSFRLHVVAGGHLFVREAVCDCARIIAADLVAALPS